jgi:3-oxoacyl-(acyl-carrier-protein) synthase
VVVSRAASVVFVHGIGAVSPAGWGLAPFRDALLKGEALAVADLPRPGWERRLRVRRVPALAKRLSFLAHARLRRTSPITQFAVGAALEALGEDAPPVSNGSLRLGVVFCTMTGCVNYSRRFYDETLRDPATASPLVFPETVFNAPSSHLAALLGSTAINYTLVGDSGAFLQGLALAADWLLAGQVDGCLVVGAEECDWLTADAFRLFDRRLVMSEGAGAVYLKTGQAPASSVALRAVTSPHLFTQRCSRAEAARRVRVELTAGAESDLLCEGIQKLGRYDAAERAAWSDWRGARLAPKEILGEGLMAASAWQCVAAIDSLKQGRFTAADVSVVGCNEQAIGARFARLRPL